MIKKTILYLTVLFLFLSCSRYGNHLDFNEGVLYYTRSVSEEEVNKLGNFLVEAGFFDGTKKAVQLDKRNDTFLFRLVVKKEKQQNKESEDLLFLFSTTLSWKVFEGKAVEAHICDDRLKTVKVVQAVSYFPEEPKP